MRWLSLRKTRVALIFTWLGFFLINLAALFWLFFKHWVEHDTFVLALKQLSELYAPYVGSITLFYWSGRSPAGSPEPRLGIGAVLALSASLLYNLLLTLLLVPVTMGAWKLEDAIQNLRDVASLLSWLVAGAMGYYFAVSAGPAHTRTGGAQ